MTDEAMSIRHLFLLLLGLYLAVWAIPYYKQSYFGSSAAFLAANYSRRLEKI